MVTRFVGPSEYEESLRLSIERLQDDGFDARRPTVAVVDDEFDGGEYDPVLDTVVWSPSAEPGEPDVHLDHEIFHVVEYDALVGEPSDTLREKAVGLHDSYEWLSSRTDELYNSSFFQSFVDADRELLAAHTVLPGEVETRIDRADNMIEFEVSLFDLVSRPEVSEYLQPFDRRSNSVEFSGPSEALKEALAYYTTAVDKGLSLNDYSDEFRVAYDEPENITEHVERMREEYGRSSELVLEDELADGLHLEDIYDAEE